MLCCSMLTQISAARGRQNNAKQNKSHWKSKCKQGPSFAAEFKQADRCPSVSFAQILLRGCIKEGKFGFSHGRMTMEQEPPPKFIS